ncbi:hypothetical protein BXZ70DRAFT_7566 [Cristinia sonorae]|uniref:Uncharacterized protein n=1 Tax=Cristinia sonorae TaxID=1940300 RepID=A0A8K0UZJ4_9AGAR|nr:hypothetical protein BXZ70DRAFT_7566 [Cristinia sonorae]
MAIYPNMNLNMNVFYEIPLETPPADRSYRLSLRASVSQSHRPPCETVCQPKFHTGCKMNTQNMTGEAKENHPSYGYFDDSVLSKLSPLDALPLNLKNLEDIRPPFGLEGMDVDDRTSECDSSSDSSLKSSGTLRERRLHARSPNVKNLQIHVPPVWSEYLPVSPVLVGSSDFIVWLDSIVTELYPSAHIAQEARQTLLSVADEPTTAGFQAVHAILRDQDLVAEFTDRLATHLIHFSNEDSSDGLRSAWSDSTGSAASDYECLDDLSPSDIAMGLLRSVDDSIEEIALSSGYVSSYSEDAPIDEDLMQLYDFSWS